MCLSCGAPDAVCALIGDDSYRNRDDSVLFLCGKNFLDRALIQALGAVFRPTFHGHHERTPRRPERRCLNRGRSATANRSMERSEMSYSMANRLTFLRKCRRRQSARTVRRSRQQLLWTQTSSFPLSRCSLLLYRTSNALPASSKGSARGRPAQIACDCA